MHLDELKSSDCSGWGHQMAAYSEWVESQAKTIVESGTASLPSPAAGVPALSRSPQSGLQSLKHGLKILPARAPPEAEPHGAHSVLGRHAHRG